MVAIPMVRSWNREISPFLSIFGLQRSGPKQNPSSNKAVDVSEVGGTNYSCTACIWRYGIFTDPRMIVFNGFDEG